MLLYIYLQQSDIVELLLKSMHDVKLEIYEITRQGKTGKQPVQKLEGG